LKYGLRLARWPGDRWPSYFCAELPSGNLIIKPWRKRLYSERANNLGWRLFGMSFRWVKRVRR
jgi:predicted DCC family thiol-disulfide oxidoreductase YuxK